MKIDVSIVIVSWNVKGYLDECIKSIAKNAKNINFEIIVVDNHSKDGTLEMLYKKYPYVTIIDNKQNNGFARANNQGFEIANGKYILILNPDTIVVENSIQTLFQTLENNSNLGLVGPKIIFPDGRIQITCARLLPTLPSAFLVDILRLPKLPIVGNIFAKRFITPYSFEESQIVEAISGAAILARKNALIEINGFGENFIHAGEDLDLCARIRKQGWDNYYESRAKIIHYCGKSSSQVPIRTSVNVFISITEYFTKNYSKLHGYIYKLIIQSIESSIIFIVGIYKLLFHKEKFKEFRDRLNLIKYLFLWREISD